MTTTQRFEAKIDRDSALPCWRWTGARCANGYGYFRFNARAIQAHRVAVILDGRSIPVGRVVAHKCDKRWCVNPSHLFVCSQKDNIRDASQKRRMRHGERATSAVLTEQRVIAARRAYASGLSIRAIALVMGVKRQTLSSAVFGRNWTHVDGAITPRREVA